MYIIIDVFDQKTINVVCDDNGNSLTFKSYDEASEYAENNCKELFWKVVKI